MATLDLQNLSGTLTKDTRVFMPIFVFVDVIVFALLHNNGKLICFAMLKILNGEIKFCIGKTSIIVW